MSTPSLGSWIQQAACRGVETAVFFPEPHDSGATRGAKAICAGCPVKGDCWTHAIAHPRERGVWGGMTEGERTRHRRNRDEGRAA
jgi:WhiB family redox-sensing transcriptional regulator